MSAVSLPTIEAKTPQIPKFNIIVDFGESIPIDLQGPALLSMEKWFREQGVPVEVYKPTHTDDSKVRNSMTAERRANL